MLYTFLWLQLSLFLFRSPIVTPRVEVNELFLCHLLPLTTNIESEEKGWIGFCRLDQNKVIFSMVIEINHPTNQSTNQSIEFYHHPSSQEKSIIIKDNIAWTKRNNLPNELSISRNLMGNPSISHWQCIEWQAAWKIIDTLKADTWERESEKKYL